MLEFHIERVTPYSTKDGVKRNTILGRASTGERIKFSVNDPTTIKVGQAYQAEATLGKAEPSLDEDGNPLTYEDGSPVILQSVFFKGKVTKISVSADEAFADVPKAAATTESTTPQK